MPRREQQQQPIGTIPPLSFPFTPNAKEPNPARGSGRHPRRPRSTIDNDARIALEGTKLVPTKPEERGKRRIPAMAWGEAHLSRRREASHKNKQQTSPCRIPQPHRLLGDSQRRKQLPRQGHRKLVQCQQPQKGRRQLELGATVPRGTTPPRLPHQPPHNSNPHKETGTWK